MNKIIYALVDPRDGLVFYIGRTSNLKGRISKHNSRHTNKGTPKHDYVKGILDAGLKCDYFVLDEVPKAEGKFWETFYTELFRSWGYTLYNNLYRKMGNQTSFDGESGKRPVVAVTKSGDFHSEYLSIKQAKINTGIRTISHSILRLQKLAGGLVWFYKEEYDGMSDKEFNQIMEWANAWNFKRNKGSFKKGLVPWNKKVKTAA